MPGVHPNSNVSAHLSTGIADSVASKLMGPGLRIIGGNVMSMGILSVGCLFLVVGVAYLAHLMQVPQQYVMAPLLILVGIGAVGSVQSARRSRT